MSAFIMCAESISVIASAVADAINNHASSHYALMQWAESVGCMDGRRCNAKGVFDELARFNTERVNIRYPDDNDAFVGEFIPMNLLVVSDVQLVKLVQCYLYQCSEGNNYAEQPTYQAMQSFERALLWKVVRALPAYEEAGWGSLPEAKPAGKGPVNILDLL